MPTIREIYHKQLCDDLALSLSPVMLAARAGFSSLDFWQEKALTSNAPQQLWLVARGGGKSQVAALLSLSFALQYPGSLTLLASAGLRQSQELFKKVTDAYEALNMPQTEAITALKLELKNKSRIICLSSNPETSRGYHAAPGKRLLLIIDEAAFCSDLLISSLRPSLATSKNPRLVMLSTGNGKIGAFWQAWEHGGNDFERYRVPATECERISPDFLQREREALGEWFFRQEYCAEFGENTASLFAASDINRAYSESVELFDLDINEPPPQLTASSKETVEWGLT